MTGIIAKRNNTGNRWLDPILEDFFSIPSVFDRKIDGFTPKVNITETADSLKFSFEVPGINKDDIKVVVANQVLTVSGKRESHQKTEKENLIREEIYSGSFERQFTLPDSINSEAIKANCKNGILEVTLEKKEEVKPKEIEVKIS
ncbi:MAG: Hsp20/alpha crystallin family protein [Candidatus Zixiibacteriota bacterium]